MKRLGLIPSSMFLLIGAYKRELLYLDRLAVSSSDIERSFDTLRRTCDEEVNRQYSAAIDQLRRSDLLEEFDERKLLTNLMSGKYEVERREVELVNKAGNIFHLLSPFERAGRHEDREAFKDWQQAIEMWLVGLTLGIADRNNSVIPIFPGVEYLESQLSPEQEHNIGLKKTKIIQTVLDQFPVVDSTVSWEEIAEFKSDADSRSKFLALRDWITQRVHSNLSVNEIDEELEYLLDQYERHLALHKMKHIKGKLEVVIVGSAEILENLARLEFSKVAKLLFSFTEKDTDLIGAELTAPGREVAYISKVQSELFQ